MALIILDRDGVINDDSDHYIRSVEEWVPISGSLAAIANLQQAGHKIAVATNQSGLARGYYDVAALAAMHSKMQRLLAELGGQVDYIAYCPHLPGDQCHCRKPAPGMLQDILQQFEMSADDAVFVGDSYSDYQAATAAGMDFSLVRTGKGERTLAAHPELCAEQPVFATLSAFACAYLGT